ncbi:DUF309 domain-containing protein [Lyngbya confervoides]|uniref:DUF309 domain-containing protein n=1 Tax=Lyngbya confervoides BDU141951 TaxID=1574623 RepID=A0ABD4T9K2_9CYAN|nr:DUF309 domain-containing protein [Lyngbya confervoides]MCM1985237.1 DUF309 domain-containing protein [Lyngbya confervoides BDU141951]
MDLAEHPGFQQGLREFRAGEFYPCHDSLEAVWMTAAEPDKTFIQGILQIAVACYHLGNGNRQGTLILLGEGLKRLRDYQPDYAQIDVTALVRSSAVLLGQIQQLSDGDLPQVCDWVRGDHRHWPLVIAPSGAPPAPILLNLPVLNGL